jgi:competence protein ComEC
MPPLVPAVAAWVAGLAVGGVWSAHSIARLAPLAALAMAAGCGCIVRAFAPGRHTGRHGALVAAVVASVLWAGAMVGAGHRARRDRCVRALADRAAAGVPLVVLLSADPVPSRGVGGVALVPMPGGGWPFPRASGCRTPVHLLLPAHQPVPAMAGDRVLVRAAVHRQGERVRLVARGTVARHHAPVDRLLRWRGAVGRLLDLHFGAQAPMAKALLIADQRDIPAAQRDRFADAGLVHMLSVSGVHVAILAGALATLGGALRLAPGLMTAASLLVVAGYVALLGAPAPAVRSAVMLAVEALTSRVQRPVHPWTALALGAVVPTVDPAVVGELGWQLSVAGMAALVAARALLRPRPAVLRRPVAGRWRSVQRWLARIHGVRRTVVFEGLTGVCAGVVTAPLVAWHFGRLSLIAPVANLVAAPVVAVLQPALFLALAMSPVASVGSWVVQACVVLLGVFQEIARVAAALPGAAIAVAPSGVEALGCAVAVLCAMVATGARRPAPWWRAAGCAVALVVWAPLLPLGSGQLEAHILDVGQGDAIALRTPRGRWILIDAGRRWEGGDAGRRTVIPHVRRRGGEVRLFILTHAHDDHVGGAATVVEALRPSAWWEPAFVAPSAAYAQSLEVLARHRIAWERAAPGRRVQVDGVAVTVLAPDSAWTASQRDANETSVVVRVDYGARRLLFTGDAEEAEERWLLARAGCEALRADVLKLGHHGSRTSTTLPFLAAVSPRVAVASVGSGNRYGHPAPEVIDRLAARGIPVWRTDLDGTVVVRTDGEALIVQSEGGTWRWRPPQGERAAGPQGAGCAP